MPLVVHYWAHLQSVHAVHGLRCYGNITRTRNVSEYMLVLALGLVNFRINEGVVAEVWKQAIITPVPKTKLVSNVSDLRPISVTPILPRTLERLVVRDYLIMVALCNRADHYIFILFLSSSFFLLLLFSLA